MITLFLAIIPPKPIRQQLQRLCFGLPNVDWMEEENFHLTLHFFGPIENSMDLDIHAQLKEFSFSPFILQLEGVRCFHTKGERRTLWAGVKESTELSLLKKSVDNTIKDVVPMKGMRPYTPHVTLGHYDKVDERRLSEYLSQGADFISTPFLVESIVLIESHKTQKNTSIYSEIARYPIILPKADTPSFTRRPKW